MKQHNTILRTVTIFFILLFITNTDANAQLVKTSYLNPTIGNSSYKYLRLGAPGKYFGGIMLNNNSSYYGNGNDLSIFTYGNRDLSFQTGTGNVFFFPFKGKIGKIGVATTNPLYTLDIVGNAHTTTTTSQGMVTAWEAYSKLDSKKDILIGVKGSAININLLENYGFNIPIEGKDLIPTANLAYSQAAGGSFSVHIDNPIPASKVNNGIYRIGGMVSLLQGNISNYPTSGAVAAVFGEDQIKGERTFAGYFDGKVAIGTNEIPPMMTAAGTPYLFFLNGGGVATEFRVKQLWADYVFAADYIRPTIEDEIQYIQENGHLMGFESAEEMGEYIELGDVTVRQQAKIEEMRLDMFDMYKENESLKTELKNLQEEQKEIKELLKKLLEK